ncbi:hypothetical protein CesoFtcFv8_016770 [Champsocephalus esox]|uniref:Uncharacterized protein n=1 Tax=Champsocephalus esox TaxID=159716 RepID=A0AAN8BNZ4_9TELE|nr:hypothetical protein CesoFtcFv8_016770 [Champsocephalus esox]
METGYLQERLLSVWMLQPGSSEQGNQSLHLPSSSSYTHSRGDRENQGGKDGRCFGLYPFPHPLAHSLPYLSSHSPLFSNQ